jgi:hypothetical protein
MTRPEVRIYNSEGEFIDREMTDAEYEEHLVIAARDKAKFEAEVEAKNAKAALLERLGITEAEARLLLS